MDTAGIHSLEFEVQLTFKNIVPVFQFFDKREDKASLEKCFLFLESNADELIKEETKFLQLPFKLLINLFSRATFNLKEVFKFPLLLEWHRKHNEFALFDLLRFIRWEKVSAGDYATYVRPTSLIDDEVYFKWFMESTANQFSLTDHVAKLLEKYAEQLKANKSDVCRSKPEIVSQTGYNLYPPSSVTKTTKNQCSWPKRVSVSETAEMKTPVQFYATNTQKTEVSPAYTVQFISVNECETLECRYCKQSFPDKLRRLRHEKDFHTNKIGIGKKNATNASSSDSFNSETLNEATNYNRSKKAVPGSLKMALQNNENEDESNNLVAEVNEVPNNFTNGVLNGTITDYVVNRKGKIKPYKPSRTSSIWNSEQTNKNVLTFVRSGERIFACKVCRKEFPSLSRTRMHVATVHLHQKNFKCGHCGKLFTNRTNLLIHIEAIHGDNIPRYECDRCNEKFMTRQYLYCHKKRVH